MIEQYYKIEGFKSTLDLRVVNHGELNKVLNLGKEKIFNFADLQKLAAVLWDNRDTIGFNIEDFVLNELDVVEKTIMKRKLSNLFGAVNRGFLLKGINFDYQPSIDNPISSDELKLYFDEILELGLIPNVSDLKVIPINNNPSWTELCKMGFKRNCVINRQFSWYEVQLNPMKDSSSGQIIPVCISYQEFVL